MADEDQLGALLRGLQWGADFRRSGNIEDRRDEPATQAMLPRANVTYPLQPPHQPTALASYLSDLIMPPSQMAKDLGYYNIHPTTKDELDNFNMYVNDLDQDARNYWNDDPIGQLLNKLPKKYTEAK